MSDAHPDKDPTAPALPDSSRLPNAPYQQVLTGQPALVTGANSGIGRAVALGLARAGADVVVNYVTRPETADAVAHGIEGMGRRAIALKADVSKEDEVEAMYAPQSRSSARSTSASATPGLQQDAAFQDMTLAQWNKVIAINLTGQFLCRARRRGSSCGAAACRSVVGGGQDHLHELGARGHPMGRARELRRGQGRGDAAHEEHGAGAGAGKDSGNSIAPGAIQTPINRAAWDTPEA